MNKNFSRDIDVCELDDRVLELINSFAVKPMEKDELFTFNVVLCDNEVDRDFERFDNTAIEKLADMFIGKTGIFDHSMKSSDQTARIFDTQVVTDASKRTSYGETYKFLKAKAYMPLIEKNADLVREISAGIKKEVSVNCSISKRICSICKNDAHSSSCRHIKGKKYGNSICHHILTDPTDAYEWSFVAVPAQKNAGITKSFKERTVDFLSQEGIFSVLKSVDSSVTLTQNQSKQLLEEIEKLEKKAKEGEEYRTFLKSEVMRLSIGAMPQISSKSIENICNNLPICELKSLKSDFEKAFEKLDGKPQLSKISEDEKDTNTNKDFMI